MKIFIMLMKTNYFLITGHLHLTIHEYLIETNDVWFIIVKH